MIKLGKYHSPIPLANFSTTPTQSWSGTPPNKAPEPQADAFDKPSAPGCFIMFTS